MDMSEIGITAKNVRRIAHLDIPGGGQVFVKDGRAYIGHIAPPEGTSIIDVSDLSRPKVLSTIMVPNTTSHSHKARVHGDIMLVNSEYTNRHQSAAGKQIPIMKKKLREQLGRNPTDEEVCTALNYRPEDYARLVAAAAAKKYEDGGLRIYNVADPTNPKQIGFFKTGGNGVHRFDSDGRYAYISTGMDGYARNIVMIVDISDPTKPREVSRWWLPGQWLEGGEEPTWGGLRFECHHPLRFGDRLYVSYHAAGTVILDISDITKPKPISHYNYHPPLVFSTHTYARMPFKLGGRDIAVVVDEQSGRPKWADAGHVPGFMWVFDVTNEADPKPIATYFMSPEDTPWKRGDMGFSARFGAHQCHEKMRDSLVYVTWFRGGLRIVDIADPFKPREVGFFIPTPSGGQKTVQSNDVFVDDNGIIYVIDRLNGLDILEYTGPAGTGPR